MIRRISYTRSDRNDHGISGNLPALRSDAGDLPYSNLYISVLDPADARRCIFAEACAGIGKSIADLDAATQDDERCPHNIETCAVRLVGAACEAFTAINRLEVRDYAAIVAFRRLCKIWLLIHSLCDRLGVQPDTIMRENIKKLKRRYPEGFDAERSNERYEQS